MLTQPGSTISRLLSSASNYDVTQKVRLIDRYGVHLKNAIHFMNRKETSRYRPLHFMEAFMVERRRVSISLLIWDAQVESAA